jgi:hypothetical protein
MTRRSRRSRVYGSVGTALVALFSLLAEPAMAPGPGWTANSTIRSLVVTTDGGVNVRLAQDLTGCVSQSGYGSSFASVYPNHPGINRIKADLLAAYLTGRRVSLYLGDDTCKVLETNLGGW